MKGGSVRDMSKQIVPFNSEHVHIYSSFFAENVTLDVGPTKDEILIFYEPITRKYFRSTLSNVIQAEYHFNRNFALGKLISLNEYLEFLGIGKVGWGEDIGWWSCMENCDGIAWIDFSHVPAGKDEDKYYIIDIMIGPEHF